MASVCLRSVSVGGIILKAYVIILITDMIFLSENIIFLFAEDIFLLVESKILNYGDLFLSL